jgi:Uncharacterised protein conserved in bacteria (DUF2336)
MKALAIPNGCKAMLDQRDHATIRQAGEGGRDLLHVVTDLFLLDDAPSHASRDHYAFIASHSLARMSGRDRAFYARWVASEPTLPRPVAQRLAGDEQIAVARLVLRLSPVLTDDDLTAIALTHSQSHLIAIAERAALAEITTDVLASRGDLDVLRTLSGNAGARLSDRGLSKLADRGGHDPQIAANLADRGADRRERQAQRLLRIAVASEEAEAEPARDARRRQQQVSTLIADILKGRRALGDVVALLAGADRAFDLAVVLATPTRLAAAPVLKALLAPDATGIAVVCRVLNLDRAAFGAILKLRAGRLRQDQARIDRDLEGYGTLGDEVSRRTLQALRERMPDPAPR